MSTLKETKSAGSMFTKSVIIAIVFQLVFVALGLSSFKWMVTESFAFPTIVGLILLCMFVSWVNIAIFQMVAYYRLIYVSTKRRHRSIVNNSGRFS